MAAISCKVVRLAFSGTAERKILMSRLVKGIDNNGRPLTEEHLADPHGQISWDVLTELIERLREELGSDEALRNLGDDYLSSETFTAFRRVGRALSSPKDLYYLGARWAGPSVLPMVRAEMSELDDGRLVQTLTIDEPYRDCPAIFHLIQGILINSPRSWGHGRSRVHLALAPRRGTYTIEVDQSGRGQIGRVFRALTSRVAYPTMLHEIEKQQSALDSGYHELRQAHDRIAAQAADLERVISIGRILAEDIDLNHLADALLNVLLQDLGLGGAELWLIRDESLESTALLGSPRDRTTEVTPESAEAPNVKPRFFRRDGSTNGDPDRVYDLEAAGRPLGALRVWTPNARYDQARETKEALLDRLLPWIAIALDNASTYEAIERRAADLEERVKERTARLLTANHHLVREIDERRRATEALLASEAQLRASERLASIGTLAAGIAHEINNPIGSILAAAQFAQVTRDDPDAKHQVEHALTDIVAEAKRCGDIVRSILQFSRDERTEKWPCRMADIVQRSIRLTSDFTEENEAVIRLQGQDESEARVHLDSPHALSLAVDALRIDDDTPMPAADRMPWCHVNPIQIEQALVNLFRNAIESGGRKIDVVIHHDRSNQKLGIQVCDDGPGIAESDRHRIFEPFFTTKQGRGGTGLGLSVVHGIATEHGGELQLQPNSTGGTVAVFELPTCAPPPVPIEDKTIRTPDLGH